MRADHPTAIRVALAIFAPMLLGLSPMTSDRPRVGTLASDDCEIPIGWRIEAVDERFDMTHEEARIAVREAAGLWERAAGRPLFERDPDEGFPIRFVWDSRHQVMQQRLGRENQLAEQGSAIRERRSEVDRLSEELSVGRGRYEDRLDALRSRQDEHRERIEYWEARAGPPPDVAQELDLMREELERERERLNERAEELNELTRLVNERTDELNGAIADFNRLQSELARTPNTGILTGFYRESSRAIGTWVLSVEREIEIYQFDDFDHLLRAIAHELGHALGLGYAADPSAIMYQHARSARAAVRGLGGAQLHPRDVELLGEACSLPSS